MMSGKKTTTDKPSTTTKTTAKPQEPKTAPKPSDCFVEDDCWDDNAEDSGALYVDPHPPVRGNRTVEQREWSNPEKKCTGGANKGKK
jgi:hypothetical protein